MFRAGFCGMALAASMAAHAQDDDNDGVQDATDNCVGLSNPLQTDDNSDGHGDDCVSVSATVAPSAVLGSGVSVQSRASVGAFATVGDDSTIAPAARLDAGVNSADGIVLGSGAVISRNAVVETDVTTGASATLGRSARLGEGSDAGASLFLGYASSVGSDALLGDNVVIGNLVDVGDGADFANNVVLARSGVYGDDVTAEAGVVVGPDANVANGVTLRNGSRLRKNVTVGLNSDIGSNVRIARDVTIGANVTVQAGARIGAGSDVGDFATITTNEIVPRNTTITGTGGIIVQNSARRFADGSVADRCETYVNSPSFIGPNATSGVYTVDAGGSEYNVYCDMDTDGGGWTMCYSESGNGEVHVRTDEYTGAFGVDGYRARCRDIPFSEVLYTAHDRNQQAWFTRDTPGDLVATTMGFGGTTTNSGHSVSSGTFTGNGIAATAPHNNYSGSYQLLMCDTAASQSRLWMEVGFMMSGATNKNCGSWSSDTSSPYYRVRGDWSGSTYTGQAFNENGHEPAGDELMSVGLR